MKRQDSVAVPGFQPSHDGVVHKNDVAAVVVVVPPIVGVAIGTAEPAQALTTKHTHTHTHTKRVSVPYTFLLFPLLPGQYVDSNLFPYVAVAVVVVAVAEVPT
jgi:hypothetical protein